MTGHTTPDIAEPSAAPSVEQIAEALRTAWRDDYSVRSIAEAIHALYGTPGDAREPETDWEGIAGAHRREARAAQERAEKAEARLESVESEADAAHTIANRLRAEVERHKAALEAAKRYHWTRDEFEVREGERREAEGALAEAERVARNSRANLVHHREAYEAAARADVEAETSEEADRG
jgi:hypothetical protein